MLWLAGKVSGIKAGDRLLLVTAATLVDQSLGDYSWIRITGVTAATDPLGKPVTQLAFSSMSGSLQSDAQAADYVLLRPRQSSPLWTYANAKAIAITANSLELAGLARGLAAGSLILIDIASAPTAKADSEVAKTNDKVTALSDPAEKIRSEIMSFERRVVVRRLRCAQRVQQHVAGGEGGLCGRARR